MAISMKMIENIKEKVRPNLLAISIGVVYLWFGSLKFFPSLSPAEGLAKNTIHELTFGFLPDSLSIVLLAIMEVGIGICLLLNIWRKQTIIVALFHMALTFAPLVLFPYESFQEPPLVPTLLGQYIGKNFIIVAALLSLMQKQSMSTSIIKDKS
ncbi:hypothetical protein [Flagellimonas sp. S3867]|uniref:hypothetical protein n=1 Tax=Flagellimonas sp. S3867 TaxID=2768063 RepID=UPI001CC240FC|nr:hypothetical protein [Flagellimonas sp. S3867]